MVEPTPSKILVGLKIVTAEIRTRNFPDTKTALTILPPP